MARLITRKEFLKTAGMAAPALFCSSQAYGFFSKKEKTGKSIKGHIFKSDAPPKPWKWSIEAFHYASDGTTVQCQVCPNRCVLAPGDRSICRSRVNIGGKLYSLAYGNPCALHVDPIEKKPLYHFYPGSSIFSIATAGCNFRCLNCQNWEISQRKPEEVRHAELFPSDVVKAAQKANADAMPRTFQSRIILFPSLRLRCQTKASARGPRGLLPHIPEASFLLKGHRESFAGGLTHSVVSGCQGLD